MTDILIISLVLVLVVLQGILFLRLRKQQDLVPELRQQLEEKHRAMLHDLHEGLTRLGDRLMASSADASENCCSPAAASSGSCCAGAGDAAILFTSGRRWNCPSRSIWHRRVKACWKNSTRPWPNRARQSRN